MNQEQRKLTLYPELVKGIEKALEERKSEIKDHLIHIMAYITQEEAAEFINKDKLVSYYTDILNKVKEIES